MSIFQLGFVVIIIVFGLLFIRRNTISLTFKVVSAVLVFIFGVIISFDTLFENGFGYSTPVDIEIINKTNSNLKIYGVLIPDGCYDNNSFVYSLGKIKSNDKLLKTIEADCVYDFSILAFNDLNEIVYIKKMDVNTKLSLQISLIERFKNDENLYLMYKDKIHEFEQEEYKKDLYKFGIIIFSILCLILIFRKKYGTN